VNQSDSTPGSVPPKALTPHDIDGRPGLGDSSQSDEAPISVGGVPAPLQVYESREDSSRGSSNSGSEVRDELSPLQLVLRGGAWTTLSQIAPIAVNIVMTPYVIHGFGLQRYGLFLLCTTITTFFGSFDGGIGNSMERYCSVYAATDDKRSATMLLTTMAALVTAVGIALYVSMFVLAPSVLQAFRIPPNLRAEGAFLLRALAVIIALTQVRTLFTAQLTARQKYALQSLIGITSYAIYAVGLVVTVEGHHGLRGVGVTFVVQAVFATILIVPSACRYLVRSGVHFLSRTETVAFLRYAWNVQLLGLAGMVSAQIDTFVVGAILPISAVAIYSSGANFSNQLRSVPLNALRPMAIVLSRRYGTGGHLEAKAAFLRMQRPWVQAVTGWSAVAAGAAYFGVSSWLGSDFRLSGVVALLLVASNAVNLWAGPLTLLTAAVGHPELEARYGIAGAVINVVLTVPFVFAFGLLGTVVATAVGQVVSSLYMIRIVRRRYDPNVRSFLREVPIVQSVIVAGFVILCELLTRPVIPRGPLGLLLAGVVASPGLLLYAALVFGPRRCLAFARGRFSRSIAAEV
jgi:O-antigen/teichoic acid export membrane protein